MTKRELIQKLLIDGDLDEKILIQTSCCCFSDIETVARLPVAPVGLATYAEATGSEAVVLFCDEPPKTARELALEILGVEGS